MSKLLVTNPFNGELIETLSWATSDDANRVLSQSMQAFDKWKRSSSWERSQLLENSAKKLETEKEEFASLICKEAGKPIRQAQAEVQRAIGVLHWAAAETQRFAGELLRLDTTESGRPGFGIHTRFPRGPVLGITPFNFPLNLVMHKIAPAIASGCSIVIKPSPATPLTALKLLKLFDSTTPNLVQVILANDELTADVTRAKEIATISFTGSARVGWIIRKQAPEKPTTLELGGNAWVIITEDTPPDAFPAIAQRISSAAYGYAGQSCISVQNVAIHNTAWNKTLDYLKEETLKTPFGDPSLTSVITGPVINKTAADRIRKKLSAIDSKIEVTQKSNDSSSNVISPTLITSQSKNDSNSLAPIVQEEIFGPVMVAERFESLPELIQKINSSLYGLQAGVFTQNWPVIETLYRELNIGGLVVNDVPTTRYDNQPYGGVKESGQGREGIKYAMDEMTESKFLALSSRLPGLR